MSAPFVGRASTITSTGQTLLSFGSWPTARVLGLSANGNQTPNAGEAFTNATKDFLDSLWGNVAQPAIADKINELGLPEPDETVQIANGNNVPVWNDASGAFSVTPEGERVNLSSSSPSFNFTEYLPLVGVAAVGLWFFMRKR